MFNNPGGGGFDLGSAHGRIIIAFDGSGIKQAQQQMDGAFQNIGRGISSIGGQFQQVGAQMTLLTAPIIAFGAQGVQAAARFEDALKEIEVRAGLTTDQMESVRSKALEIGRDTQFSAGQGVEAFLQLLTAGQSVEEAFLTIDSVIMGAAASGEELGFVSDGLTDIMAALNLRVEDVGGVVQAMSDAAASSSAEFSDLVMGFQNLGGAASQFNIPMREQAAILALFSENGIKGAEAGTQLRSMLRAMSADTDRTQGAWQRLGTSMFDATGAARPLGDVMEDIRAGLAGMTDEQRTRTIQDLAGSFGQLGLIALTSGDSIEDMMSMMSQGADVADVAAARMDTFSGAIAFLRGSIETFQINTLTPFLNDVLRPLVMRVAELINAFDAWGQENPALRNTIVGLVAAVTTLGPAMIGIGTILKVVGPLLGGFGTVLGIIASPIGIVVAGVSGLALALDALNVIDLSHFGDVLRGIAGTAQLIIEGNESWIDSLTETIMTVGDLLKIPPEQMRPIAQEIGRVGEAFNRFLEATQAGVPLFDAAMTLIGDIFGSEFEGEVKRVLDEVSLFVGQEVIPRLEALRDWFVTDALPAIVDFVNNTALPAIQGFLDILEGSWLFVSVALQALYQWFVENGLPVIQGVIETVKEKWDEFQTTLSNLWATVQPHLQPIIDWFRDTFQHIATNYIQPVINAVQSIIDRVGQALDQLRILGGGAPGSVGVTGPPGYTPVFGSQSYDMGGLIRAGQPALIGTGAQPELFVPSTSGTMVPNADQLMGGGITIQNLTISANSYAEGAAAAEGFDARMKQLRRSAG